MEERRGDARIYLISALFFICIVSGGVFLGLYLLSPVTESTEWYPVAGMTLVGIPWAFWVLTYFYASCCKSRDGLVDERPLARRSSAGSSVQEGPNPVRTSCATTMTTNKTSGGSPAQSPGGERHVRFGGVVVVGGEERSGRRSLEGNSGYYDQKGEEESDTIESTSRSSTDSRNPHSSKECEMPLNSTPYL